MQKVLKDLLSGSFRTKWGSFAPDMSGGTSYEMSKKADFTGGSGPGGGEEAFGTKGGGLASLNGLGADDNSLIKEFNK